VAGDFTKPVEDLRSEIRLLQRYWRLVPPETLRSEIRRKWHVVREYRRLFAQYARAERHAQGGSSVVTRQGHPTPAQEARNLLPLVLNQVETVESLRAELEVSDAELERLQRQVDKGERTLKDVQTSLNYRYAVLRELLVLVKGIEQRQQAAARPKLETVFEQRSLTPSSLSTAAWGAALPDHHDASLFDRDRKRKFFGGN
jgi:hypothetical protein